MDLFCNTKTSLLVSLLFLAVVPLYARNPGQAATTDTISKAEPVLISDQFSFTEGPAVDKHGNIFFTDQPNNKIWEYSTRKRLSVFMDPAGRSNGMCFDHKGNLISCADQNEQLWSISPDKKVRILVKDFQGQKLNGPNDVWVDPRGGMYITDPYYQRSYWKRTHPDIKGENVYYLPPGDSVLRIVVEDMEKPNGIIGTRDGTYLYVSDIGAGKTYKYRIAPDGNLQDKQMIVPQGSDGMTIDNRGDIYLTGNGVTIYNPSGVLIKHIPIPGPWTSHVCFGGRRRDQLFITATKSIYVLQTEVKGTE